MNRAKLEARIGALESKATPTAPRITHLLALPEGQTKEAAIAASGFNPNDDFIFLVGMSRAQTALGPE
jgi:hypothetical protein